MGQRHGPERPDDVEERHAGPDQRPVAMISQATAPAMPAATALPKATERIMSAPPEGPAGRGAGG